MTWMLWRRIHSPLEWELARASLTLSTSVSPVPWTHTTLSGVWEGKLKILKSEIFLKVSGKNDHKILPSMFYTKFSGESSNLIGRKVRVVVEDNEGGFPLAAGLVKFVELHWNVIGTPRERGKGWRGGGREQDTYLEDIRTASDTV